MFLRLLVVVVSLVATVPAAAAADLAPVEFTTQTLPNGLRVIYAPLRQAPVVHVRVLYHVGSKDERPDRQGFAHMFEHMMFRGSKHVPAEEHMKRVNRIGGETNAFTSFDQTTYIQTFPSSHLEMVLYLEADRMASFKVTDETYRIERNVVNEEYRQRNANAPYGYLFIDFLNAAFTKHSYRWTPIGNMEQLRAAPVSALQEFWNTYYVPNNAILVIAGDIDVEKTKALVEKYYGWIPKGPAIERNIPVEPQRAEAKRVEVKYRVPLSRIQIGFPIPDYRNSDHYALDLLGSILGGGRTSRLTKALVQSEKPIAVGANAGPFQLDDPGLFMIQATVLQGKKPDEVEAALWAEIAKIVEAGVTQEELDRAKQSARLAIINSRDTAEEIASALGEAWLFGGDPGRVNSDWEIISKLTTADIHAVAKKYLVKDRSVTLVVKPDAIGRKPVTGTISQDVTATTQPVEPRPVSFPAGYATAIPDAKLPERVSFAKGQEITVAGVRVVVIPDSRLPLVSASLVMRSGSHSEPVGKEGLGSITADMVRRGTTKTPYSQLNELLESRGISIEVGDSGDTTRLGVSTTSDQFAFAIQQAREILLSPAFPEDEFNKLKQQTLSQLRLSLDNPGPVASIEIASALYGPAHPLGRRPSLDSVSSLTLADVKAHYAATYHPANAILIISGDVTVESGQKLAAQLLADWNPKPLAAVNYPAIDPAKAKRRIILVDRPVGQQATIRLAIPAYTVKSDDKYAGDVANQVLSGGIESRIMKYVRAEKGYVYGASAVFQPGRFAGVFGGGTETALPTTAATIEAMFEVIEKMRKENITPAELADAQSSVAGSMVMRMQTIGAQANMRLTAILSGYPDDYYETYAARVAKVTLDDVRKAMNTYARTNDMIIVVVAPAEKVKEQLDKLGTVEVLQMPALRKSTTKPTDLEMIKPNN